MKTPDVTKAQVIALAGAIVGAVSAFVFPLSQSQQGALVGLAGAGFVVLVWADAAIRRHRARYLAPALYEARIARLEETVRGLVDAVPARRDPPRELIDLAALEARFAAEAERENEQPEWGGEPPELFGS